MSVPAELHPPSCAAPDPAPRPPALAVPALACDSHAHVFGPPERYPYRPGRRYTPAPSDFDRYRAMLRATGLQRAVVVQPDLYADNRVTEDVLSAGGDQWRGIARLFAGMDSAELRRLSALGFRGIRLDGRDPARLSTLEDVATILAPLGWHVQIHLFARDLPTLAGRLQRLAVPVVLDHFARIDAAQGIDQPGFVALLELIRAPHVWVKLSAAYRLTTEPLPYATVTPFAQALIQAAPDRVLWGSDWPHSSYGGAMPNDGALLDVLTDWAPDAATRAVILRDNPAALYFH